MLIDCRTAMSTCKKDKCPRTVKAGEGAGALSGSDQELRDKERYPLQNRSSIRKCISSTMS